MLGHQLGQECEAGPSPRQVVLEHSDDGRVTAIQLGGQHQAKQPQLERGQCERFGDVGNGPGQGGACHGETDIGRSEALDAIGLGVRRGSRASIFNASMRQSTSLARRECP